VLIFHASGKFIGHAKSLPQALKGGQILLKNSHLGAQPPKGASVSEELTVSLKRYPDTRGEFFGMR
jgi:hypothetical protein